MSWGALAGTAVSAFGAHQANKKNIALAREQMAFQERMSNTAHQRQVKDMRKAGLNPALSATGGAGASTGQGATAQVKNIAEDASSSAISFMTGLKQIQKMDSEIQNIQADTATKQPVAKTASTIGKVIDEITPKSNPFSAKSLNSKKNVLESAYRTNIKPQVHSAKKKFKSFKKSVTDKYQSIKNKFQKWFD